jgi:hypothetical protein
MTTWTVEKMTRGGLTPTWNTCTAQDKFVNDGSTYIHIRNTGPQSILTIPAVKLCSQGEAHNISVTVVATTGESIVGPFPQGSYNDATGYVQVFNSAPAATLKMAFVSYIDG